MVIAGYPRGQLSGTPTYLFQVGAIVSDRLGPALFTILLVVGLYWLTAKVTNRSLNPLELSKGNGGKASLSKFQVLLFSYLIMGKLAFIVFRTGALTDLSADILLLLGISGGGAAAAKAVSVGRERLSFANWSWLVDRHWIEADPKSLERPMWRHLVTTGDEFDVTKLQMLGFSVVVAIALLIQSTTDFGSFTIPDTLLGVLGLSQVVYLGGKVTKPGTFADVDARITALRELEGEFVQQTVERLKTRAQRTEEAVIDEVPGAYEKYRLEVTQVERAVRALFDIKKPLELSEWRPGGSNFWAHADPQPAGPVPSNNNQVRNPE